MALSSRNSIPQAPDPDEVGRALQRFVDTRGPVAQAIVDDLVRVRVGPALHVEVVEILDDSIDPGLRQRLETAIAGAVNTALRRSTLAAAEALREHARQRSATVAPGGGADTGDASG